MSALTSISSWVPRSVEDNVSQFLFAAREKTCLDGKYLLKAYQPIREGLIEEFSGKEITLLASNGDSINGLHFEGKMKKAIIFLHGNACFYETSAGRPLGLQKSLAVTSADGNQSFPHLIVFNPRGTAKSTGITEPDHVAEDFQVLFEYLVNDHLVDPNEIAIVGHSMGGFFGAFGAERIQSRFPNNRVNFMSDRSFSDLHDRVEIKVENEELSKFTAIGMHSALSLLDWDKDPIAALDRLKGRVCIIYNKQDGVIPYKESVHFRLAQSEKPRSYSSISLQEEEEEVGLTAHAHNRTFTEEENQQVIIELKLMLSIP